MGGGSEDERPSTVNRARATLGRRPVVSFVALMFAWSWGYWALVWLLTGSTDVSFLLTWPGLWGPLFAGVVVAWSRGDRVRAFLGRAVRADAGWRWFLLGVGAVAAIDLVGPVVRASLSGGGVELNSPITVLVTFAVAIFAGGSEEVGLRGVAHPHLRDRHGALRAGLAIGAFWAVWHLPLQFLGVGFDGRFWLFAASAVAISVLLGWLYDASGESVLVVVFAHAAVDAPSLLTASGTVSDETWFLSRVTVLAVYWALVVALVAARGRGLAVDAPDSQTRPGEAAVADDE